MTREERHIAVLNRMLESMDVYDSIQPTTERKKAIKAAIQALSQEPCTDAVSRDAVIKAITNTSDIRGDVLNALYDLPSVNPQPCDDAISREAVLEWLKDKDIIKLKSQEENARKELKSLPSVTQKSGKWDRLYSWLNDMRLGIAPDETVTDIDERHCRESQTDILDEIMEWMIKAEVEPQESEE